MNMKKCSKCGVSQSIDQFNRRSSSSDGLQHHCKSCNKKRLAKHYENNKSYYIDKSRKWKLSRKAQIDKLKSVPCADCKNFYPPYIMDFDHRDNTKKLFNIGQARSTKSKQSVDDEIAKCDVVCSNCHRERTHQRLQADVS